MLTFGWRFRPSFFASPDFARPEEVRGEHTKAGEGEGKQ